MSTRQDILAVIPARGGSKGLPGKNIRPLLGKPLLAWSLEAARRCPLVDRVILSSEDEEIMAVARRLGCDVPFIRPLELAGDTASAIDVLLHAWEALGRQHSWLVLLQPTSPLRLAEDITACLRLCLEGCAPAAVSMTLASKPPHWMVTLDQNGHPQPLMGSGWTEKQRQELPKCYLPNGAVYVARTDWLLASKTFITPETAIHLMPPERSVDIDSATDFYLAQIMLEERQHGHF